MRIPVRLDFISSRGVLGLAAAVMFGIAGNSEAAAVPTNITIEPAVVVLPLGARTQLGFQFGPVDGVMGGVKESPSQYRFFGSGQSLNTAAVSRNARSAGRVRVHGRPDHVASRLHHRLHRAAAPEWSTRRDRDRRVLRPELRRGRPSDAGHPP